MKKAVYASILLLFLLITLVSAQTAKRGKKVYILSDMEGVSGVYSIEEQAIPYQSPRFAESVRLLTGEINAAVEALLEGGITEIQVFDAHSDSNSLSVETLHPKAKLITKVYFGTFELDRSFDAMIIIGQHAMSGARNGVLDHSYNSGTRSGSNGVQNLWLNNKLVGEIGMSVAWAGAYGIPVIMLSGDRAACDEMLALVPNAKVASVKEGLGRNSAIHLSHEAARALIKDEVKRAVTQLGQFKPYVVAGPVEIKTELFNHSALPQAKPTLPFSYKLDERTYVIKGENFLDAWKKWWN
jgi:D-amino peptidase